MIELCYMRVKFVCGGCGAPVRIELDDTDGGSYKDIYDIAEGAVRSGYEDLGEGHFSPTSVQGGMCLCATCTKLVDDNTPEDAVLSEDDVVYILAKLCDGEN